jgi:hypothetical protein
MARCEPHVVLDLAVDLEREVANQQEAALLDERQQRGSRHRRVGCEQKVDLVDVEQLCVDRRRLRCARLVVIDDELDLPAEQPALRVDLITPDFDAEQRGLAAAGETAGLRHGHADLDRTLLCERARGERECGGGKNRTEKCPAFHRSSQMFVARLAGFSGLRPFVADQDGLGSR